MERNPQELLEAAKVLKEHCESVLSSRENSSCPFYDKESSHCLIKTYPTNWELNKIKED